MRQHVTHVEGSRQRQYRGKRTLTSDHLHHGVLHALGELGPGLQQEPQPQIR